MDAWLLAGVDWLVARTCTEQEFCATLAYNPVAIALYLPVCFVLVYPRAILVPLQARLRTRVVG